MQASKISKWLSYVCWRFVLALMAIVVTLFLAVQVAFIGGWLWLQSGSGQQWLSAEIETAMKDSGYHVAFGNIGYRPFNTVVARDLSVTDDGGKLIAAIDRISIHAGFASLLQKQLRLSVDIGTLAIGHGGAETDKAREQPAESIVIPDIYITSAVIEKLAVKKIVDAAAPDEVLLADLAVKGTAALDRQISINLEATAGSDNPDYYPDSVTANAVFDPATLLLGIEEIKVSSDAYKLAAAGSLNLRDKGGILVQLNGKAQDLSKLAAGVAGSADLTAEITGTTAAPALKSTVNVTLSGDAYRDIKPPVITLTGTNLVDAPHLAVKAASAYQGKPVDMSAAIDVKGNAVTLKDLSVKMPGITASGSVTADTAKASASGKMRVSIRDLSPYAPDVPPYNLPQGTVDIVFTPGQPNGYSNGYAFRLNSNIAINKSRLGLSGAAAIDSAFKKLSVSKLQVKDAGQGRVDIDGYYGLSGGDAKMHAAINNFSIPAIDEVHGRVSGDIVLTQNGDDYLLSGSIRPDQVDITIPEHMSSSIPVLNVIRPGKKAIQPPDFLAQVAVKISLTAKNRIFVRGWGLDAELGGHVDVTGHLDDPQLNGQFSTVKGRYEEFGKRFTIDHAIMRFQGSVPPSPYLDVKAVTKADDIEAAILITGPASKPAIDFSSVPALPKDEVVARILFGRDVRGLSPFEAVQLADTLRRLSGEGGGGSLNPLQSFRQAVGLDDLRVDQDANGGTTAAAGKYISDKVYLEVKKGQTDNSGGANIQIDLTKRLKLESEVGQESSGAGLSWKWDY